jgi:hypothetical protein
MRAQKASEDDSAFAAQSQNRRRRAAPLPLRRLQQKASVCFSPAPGFVSSPPLSSFLF